MDLQEYWDYLIENSIATEEELQLVTDINGYSEEALDEVLFARTGYRNLEQYTESEDYDYYEENFKD